MHRSTILNWLCETDPSRLESLWAEADAVRRANVGDEVHLRGLVEVSNHCIRQCAYCGLRAPNRKLRRYRMSADEVLAAAHLATKFGYGTVVLQAGEDPKLTGDWVASVLGRIKNETPLAVTLSLGERSLEELDAWRKAGADRYLLRFETSNSELFSHIHPPGPLGEEDRLAALGRLRSLGYEVGSGVMVGVPGQTMNDLANDLELFRSLDLDMIGIGPFLPHPDTPLAAEMACGAACRRGGSEVPHEETPESRQAPNDETMTYKAVALTRLLCPGTNIPGTTALATVNRDAGRVLALQRGANVVMPNLTPLEYRACYEIYPDKACLLEPPEAYDALLREQLHGINRTVGRGRGDSPNRLARMPASQAHREGRQSDAQAC